MLGDGEKRFLKRFCSVYYTNRVFLGFYCSNLPKDTHVMSFRRVQTLKKPNKTRCTQAFRASWIPKKPFFRGLCSVYYTNSRLFLRFLCSILLKSAFKRLFGGASSCKMTEKTRFTQAFRDSLCRKKLFLRKKCSICYKKRFLTSD